MIRVRRYGLNRPTYVRPHAMLLIKDETRYWLDDDLIARCGGKIYGVYLFNERQVTYCCEITPSYELEFLESIPHSTAYSRLPVGATEREEYDAQVEDDETRSKLQDADVDTDRWIYIHCGDLPTPKNPAELKQLLTQWDGSVPCVISVAYPTRREWRDWVREHDGDVEASRTKFMSDLVPEMLARNARY